MRLSFSILSLSAALLLAAFLIGVNGDTASAQETVTVTLGAATGPDGGGSQTGTATLTANGSQTDISVNIQAGDAADEPQPIHVHEGTCDSLPGSLGAVKFDLTDAERPASLGVRLRPRLTLPWSPSRPATSPSMSTSPAPRSACTRPAATSRPRPPQCPARAARRPPPAIASRR